MSKLWQKDYELDTLMEKFTVGRDYLLDRHIVIADALASMAHAMTLVKAGVLTEGECEALKRELRSVIELSRAGKFPLSPGDEDCHTAIENFLTRKLGETGKRVHTGRSRNDQVQVALRLWMRDYLLVLALRTESLARELLLFAKKHEFVPMPGRTHMQIAMPSSVGLWASSYAEELMDEVKLLFSLEDVVDRSPLGAAASYGVPLSLDREYTASLLGFKSAQHNVLYAIDSRGRVEAMVLDHGEYIASTISKLAQDLLLFTLPELGYFSLPRELCTGSSIMPQKKNPDGLELARSRSAVVAADAMLVKSIIRGLPSGYNRDFQDTKPPLFEGASTTWMLVSIMERMVRGLIVHESRLREACVAPLYATDVVFSRVKKGEPFRDAYRDVGLNLEKVEAPADPVSVLKERTSVGASGNLGLDGYIRVAEETISAVGEMLEEKERAYERLSSVKGVETVQL